MKKINYKFLLLILLMGLFPITTKAETIQFTMCFGDNGTYSITYDDKINTEVKKEKIDYSTIQNQHIAYPTGISETEKVKYEFTASLVANKCYQEGDTIYSCPSNSDFDKYNIIGKYLSDEGVSDKITFQFNEATGRFTINIKDVFRDELYVRYVADEANRNTTGQLDASNFLGQFLTRNANGYYTISNVSGNAKIFLEFYLKDAANKCSNTYLGYIGFFTPNAYDYEVENPAISNPDFYGCTAVKNYRPTGMTRTDDINQFESVKKAYIYECYSNAKITYGEKLELASKINEKLNRLKEMFSNYAGSGSTGGKICTDQYTSTKISYSSTGNYWGLVCTETYTAQGDTPKLVKAGDGFSYLANYSVTRTCNITQINRPTKKPQCQYSISHICSWVNNDGSIGTGQHAGPTEEFDNCIYSCDGGKYSQSCINSCYSQVYSNNRDTSFTDKFISSDKRLKVEFTASQTFTSPNTNELCQTENGSWVNGVTRYCEHGVCDQTCISPYCQNRQASCTFTSFKQPSGCSDDAEGEYQAALNASEAELNRFKAKQSELVPTGNYTYQITDSYLKTEGGQPYVFTVNSKDNPAVNVSSSQQTLSASSGSLPLGNSGGRSVSYNPSMTVKADIKVNLPLSYIDKVNGDAVYKTTAEAKQAYRANNIYNRLDLVSDFDIAKYYNQNERKYYTSIWSDNINVIMTDEKIQLLRTSDYNITVKSSNVGGGSFSSNIDCYYGVYNNFYCQDPNDCPSDLDATGIQWIYRVIDLEDVFPNNRNPRWNWTGTLNRSNNTFTGAARFANATYLKYNIDPIALTEDIESKGYTIYDVKTDPSEVDYEFVLTTENLRNIRAYNKGVYDYNGDGYHNYLDYNMSCYTNNSGKEICTSRFMDNISGNSGTETSANFITYSVPGFTIDTRKNIAGCNNSKSGACVEIGR